MRIEYNKDTPHFSSEELREIYRNTEEKTSKALRQTAHRLYPGRDSVTYENLFIREGYARAYIKTMQATMSILTCRCWHAKARAKYAGILQCVITISRWNSWGKLSALQEKQFALSVFLFLACILMELALTVKKSMFGLINTALSNMRLETAYRSLQNRTVTLKQEVENRLILDFV